MPRFEYEKLSDGRLGGSSEMVRQRVEAAREKQRQRFDGVDGLRQDVACNADMGGKEHRCPADVRKHCALDDAGSSLMKPLKSSGR